MPRVDTFERLLEACGMDIELAHKRGEGVDVTLIEEMLRHTPEERLARAARTAAHLREAYGSARR